MSDFWTNLVSGFKNAVSVVEADAGPAIPVIETLAPVVAQAFPKTAPAIGAASTVVNQVSALAPSAIQNAKTAITSIEALIASGSEEVKQLGVLFGSLGHVTTVGQSIVVTPKTTAATVPAV